MEENKKSNNKVILIILALLLIGSLAYTFYTSSEHKKLTNAIEDEKHEIEVNLDSMIVKYEDAISQKTSMSKELSIERDRIIALRDSLKDLKASNYSLIRKYRKQIAQLEETNRSLFLKTDSLTKQNKLLAMNLDSVNVQILNQMAKNDTLAMENLSLAEKVAVGSMLKVNTAKIIAMRERSSGKLTETSRARNTDAFRINFTIDENKIAEQGEKEVYIQIIDNKGNVLAPKGELTLADETALSYSDKTTINYLNDAVDVISLVEVDRDLIESGVYLVRIFIDKKLSGTTQIILK